MKILLAVDGSYSLVIVLFFTLIFNTISVTGITEPEPVPMTMEQINNLLEGGWETGAWGSSDSSNLITARADEDFYIYGRNVRLDLKKDDEIITTVYPVGLRVYADIFKDDLKIFEPQLSYGYGDGDVDNNGAYEIKMRAPSENGILQN